MRSIGKAFSQNRVLANRLFTLTLLGMLAFVWARSVSALTLEKTGPVLNKYNKTIQANELKITLDVDPGQPGINTFIVAISSNGIPVTDSRGVSLEFTSLTGKASPNTTAMGSLGAGKYRVQGGYLGSPDRWNVKVVIARAGKFDTSADFLIDLSQGGKET